MSLLLALLARAEIVTPPENGPTGGANWLRGYKPPFDYSPRKDRSGKKNELLFLTTLL